MKNLDQIALENGTDKSSDIHNYAVKYEKYLQFSRLSQLTILEIGVLKGESLRMWREYYPNALIVGIDIDPLCKAQESEHIKIRIGSQTDVVFLAQVIREFAPFDLIVDDGSHFNAHVQFSFDHLFDSLTNQGIYVVEDSSASYWPHFGGSLHGKGSTMSFFKNLTDQVNFWGAKVEGHRPRHARKESILIPYMEKNHPQYHTDIESIQFLNSLILITRR